MFTVYKSTCCWWSIECVRSSLRTCLLSHSCTSRNTRDNNFFPLYPSSPARQPLRGLNRPLLLFFFFAFSQLIPSVRSRAARKFHLIVPGKLFNSVYFIRPYLSTRCSKCGAFQSNYTHVCYKRGLPSAEGDGGELRVRNFFLSARYGVVALERYRMDWGERKFDYDVRSTMMWNLYGSWCIGRCFWWARVLLWRMSVFRLR